ncbi:MAG: Rieske 2Fe-2S domain-containing protein [Acidimicrobiales bacterium]
MDASLDGMVRVLAAADLPAGEASNTEIRHADIGGADVLLARLGNGQVVAFGAMCPHQLTDLMDATIWDGNVRCPRHNYIYDPHTGENVLPSRDCRPENLWKLAPGYLPTYRVVEADGWIWVAPEARQAPESFDPELERPPARGSVSAGARSAGSSPPAQPVGGPAVQPAGPVEHPGKTLRVQAGSTFELRLPTTPRPGFVWRVEVPAALLAVVEERYEPSDPPRHRVKLAVRSVGQGTVRCSYGRPWETTAAEVRTYEVMAEPL